MARKPKRRQTTRTRRPAGPPATGAVAERSQTARPAAAGRSGAEAQRSRPVEMSLSPGAVGAARRTSRITLDSADPAIPLDRVPYFISDLVRLGIVVAVMVVLLVLAAEFVIPLVVR